MSALKKTTFVPVGGWLLIYCLSRGVVEPVYFVYSFHKLTIMVEKLLEVGFASTGFAAVLLIGTSKKVALQLVRCDLAFRLCFSVTVFIWMMNHPSARSKLHASMLLRHAPALVIAVVGLGMPVAWFLYFRLSKHVRKVLGTNI